MSVKMHWYLFKLPRPLQLETSLIPIQGHCGRWGHFGDKKIYKLNSNHTGPREKVFFKVVCANEYKEILKIGVTSDLPEPLTSKAT